MHVQEGTGEHYDENRLLQVLEFADFINQKNISQSQPVILAGDLNIDSSAQVYSKYFFLSTFYTENKHFKDLFEFKRYNYNG